MVKQKQLFKPHINNSRRSVVKTRLIKRRIQLKRLSQSKKKSLKKYLVSQISNNSNATDFNFNNFIYKADFFNKKLRRLKLNFKKPYRKENKRTKVLRELTAYHYHYKKIYRKRKYAIAPKLKAFWLKLINNSKYYNEGKLLPLAASKLYNLSTYGNKDRERITNFNKKNHKINLDECNIIKLQFSGDVAKSNAVHINLYFNPLLENKLSYYQWFSAVKDKNGLFSILKVVNPHSNQTHYINTLNTACVYLHLVNLAVIHRNKLFNRSRIALPKYTKSLLKNDYKKLRKYYFKHYKVTKSYKKNKLKRKFYKELTSHFWEKLKKLHLLPREYMYYKFKKRRAAFYEYKYGRKAKAQASKGRRYVKPKILLVTKYKDRFDNRIDKRRVNAKYNIIKPARQTRLIIGYKNFYKRATFNYRNGTKIKHRRRKKKRTFVNPFISKKYNLILKRNRKLLKAILSDKYKKMPSKLLSIKTNKLFLRRAKLVIKNNQNACVAARSIDGQSKKMFIGKTAIFSKRKKNKLKNKKARNRRPKPKPKRAHVIKNSHVIFTNLINLQDTHYINLYKNTASNHFGKRKYTYNDFKSEKFPLQRSTYPSFKLGKLVSVSKFSDNAFKQFSTVVQRKIKAKTRLLNYNANRNEYITKFELNDYLLKLGYKAINKSALSRTKLMKRVLLNKLFRSRCKSKGDSIIKVKSFKPSRSKMIAAKKLSQLRYESSLLRRYKKRHNHEIKLSHYMEFKSFRWKYYIKRWYSKISRWKRLAIFRRLMRVAWRKYRKLNKNFIFIKLFRANFSSIMGISETELLDKWVKIRRGDNANSAQSTVTRFNQALQLKMDGIAMFLGMAPNRPLAQEFVKFGGMRINGMVITDVNHSMVINDILQIDLKINRHIRALHKNKHWEAVRERVKFSRFLQSTWPLMLFMMIRYPHNYELLEESILSERWVRFFIRYFPIRISKYKKAKIKWYKY